MKYFDPIRPQFENGNGAILDPKDSTSKRLGVLPSLYVAPLPDGTWSIDVYIKRSGNVFSRIEAIVPHETFVGSFLQSWKDDPEAVLVDYFKYDFIYDDVPTPSSKSSTTLEDLGL